MGYEHLASKEQGHKDRVNRSLWPQVLKALSLDSRSELEGQGTEWTQDCGQRELSGGYPQPLIGLEPAANVHQGAAPTDSLQMAVSMEGSTHTLHSPLVEQLNYSWLCWQLRHFFPNLSANNSSTVQPMVCPGAELILSNTTTLPFYFKK